MINRLYVFANMGKLNQLPKSGGQTSARRVMKGFLEEEIEIVPIRRHRAEAQTKIGHVIEVGYFAFYDLLKMIAKMIFRRRKNAAFMQMTYAGALVPYELALSLTARLMGFKCIEYLQGGLVMDTLPCGGRIHQFLFRVNMNMQSLVCCEGMDALELTRRFTNKPQFVYLPSYIREELIPKTCPVKPINELNLCFFGRTSPVKNPIVVVDIFNELCSRHPEKNIFLTIVGSHHLASYQNKLQCAINQSPYSAHITRKENSPYSYLVEMMQRQHFYLFPTQEKAEGHSNALNEAMSQGLIPIASDYHFNKSVIGNEHLVVKGYNPKDYADKVDWVINNCDLCDLAQTMWKRVKNHYSYNLVNHKVCLLIKKL